MSDQKTFRIDKFKDALRDELVEAVALQLNHEYEDEEDFEEKFGPTNTLEEAAALYCERKCSEDIERTRNEWVSLFPQDKDYINELLVA